MNKEEFATLLNGREYGNEITKEEERIAKDSSLIIVFGSGDDVMEFHGAFNNDDEISCYGGGSAFICADGDKAFLLTSRCECPDCPYFENEKAKWAANEITAVWNSGGYSWIYRTDIPHATFDIVDDGDLYCRGIVFAVEDLEGE